MNYKNYNLLLKAIIEYVEAIKNKNISEEDIRIFMKINDIIYILISKKYNTTELYKELEQMSYELRAKYNKKLSKRIYVDFFNHFYGNEEELEEEIHIGLVKKELNIKYIREKLKKIEAKKLYYKIQRRKLYYPLDVLEHISNSEFTTNQNFYSAMSLMINNYQNNNEIEAIKPIHWICLYDNELFKINIKPYKSNN